jgi:hypothetical protein
MRFEVIVQINGVNRYLDTTDSEPFPLNYNIADIKDISSKNSSYSKTLAFPDTKNNREVFEFIYSIQSDSTFDATKKSKCWILRDTVIQFEGYLQLTDIDFDNGGNRTSYNCVIYADNDTIFTNIGEKFLSDLDLSIYDHYWTIDSITQSWTKDYTNGYYYPLIDYGMGINGLKMSGDDLNVTYFYPSYYLKPIIDQIFLESGFSYTSDFFNSDEYKNIVIPFSNKNLIPNITNIVTDSGVLFRAERSSNLSLNLSTTTAAWRSIEADTELYDPNNLYNPTASAHYYSQSINNVWAQSFSVDVDFTTEGIYNNAFTDNVWVFVKRSRDPLTGATVSGWDDTPTFNQLISWPNIPFGGNGVNGIRLRNNPNITVTDIGGGLDEYIGTVTTLDLDGSTTNRTPLYQGEEVRFFIARIGYAPLSAPICVINSGTRVYSTLNFNLSTPGCYISATASLPNNVKQKDLLKSIMKAFNLYIEPNSNNFNNLIVEPRDDYYRKYQVIKDWSKKLDVSKGIVSMIESNTQDRTNLWTYKQDKDYYNTNYNTYTQQIFGQYQYEIDNDFIKEEKKIELIFSPTPMNKISQTTEVYAPTIVNYNNGNFTRMDGMNIRMLYKDVKGLTSSDVFVFGSATYSYYPYVGYCNDPLNPTYSLNFGQVNAFYNGYNETINNLFFNYYQNQIQEISDKNSRIVTAYFNLNSIDISQFRFSDLIFFKYNGTEGYYRVNKISDYDPSVTQTTKVELITAFDYKIKRSRNYFKPLNGTLPAGPIGQIGTIGIGVGTIGDGIGVISNGDGNTYIGPKSVLIGDNNSVSTKGSIGVLGDSNEVSGEYILSTGEINRISGEDLVSLGSQNTLNGLQIFSEGTRNNLDGKQLYNMGTTNLLSGTSLYNIGIGNDITSSNSSFAIGRNISITGSNNSFGIGRNITITQSNTTAISNNIISLSASQINITGSFSTPITLYDVLVNGQNTGGYSFGNTDTIGGSGQQIFYNDIPNFSYSGLILYGGYVNVGMSDNTGASSLVISTYSTQFSNNVGGGSGTITKYFNIQTTGATPVDIIISSTAPIIISNLRAIDVVVRGASLINGYTANLFSGFKGSAQLGTTSLDEKSNFTSATSDIYCDANFIYVQVTGEIATTIDWFVKVVIDE